MLNEGDPSIVEWVYLFFLGLLISFCFGLLSRKERTILAPVLSEDVLIMPCKGILKACAMSLPVSWCYTCVVFFSFFSFFFVQTPNYFGWWCDWKTSVQDLWKSRCHLSKIEGLDHSVVNTTLGACGELPAPEEGPCLAFYIWQCGEIKVIDVCEMHALQVESLLRQKTIRFCSSWK